MSVPPIQIWPASGFSSLVTQRATVDFPDPELPTRARVFPGGISKSTPCIAATGTRPRKIPLRRTWCFVRPHTRRKGRLFPAVCASVSILEAAHPVKWLGRQFSWIAVRAYLHSFRATRFEAASSPDARQIGRLAINGRKSRVAAGYAREVPLRETHQRLRVGMKRSPKNIRRLPLFNNLAGIHNDNTIGKSRKNGWIVANHQECRAISLANFT